MKNENSSFIRYTWEFFKSLSHSDALKLEGVPPITICHRSPRRVNERMLPDNEKTQDIIENNISGYILCGHTHVQGKIEYKGKVVLNAGAVGVSLYGVRFQRTY